MVHIPRLVILGRDGILNAYREDHVKSPDEWEPIPNALEAVARLNHAGWHTVVATNQAGIGRGMIDMASINAVHQRMMQRLAEVGGRLDAVFFCPHTPEDNCDCRKPKPGLMKQIAQRYGIELRTVPMVADTLRDLQAARIAGCEPHLVRTGRAAALTDAQVVEIVQQVPATEVHDDLGDFVDFLLERAHVPTSSPMGLH
jgi:D-glycero-D-manno-heptose 1,7-bisphosphate phosphatase